MPKIKREIKTREGNLHTQFGSIPAESGLKHRARIHQGWWRMNVLNEEPGEHPKDKKNNVCNTIRNGKTSKKNFLAGNAIKAADRTIAERSDGDAGIIEQERLFNNLLSSQPLCFNFFGELKEDTILGLQVLQQWWPEITKLNKVVFEYAPKKRYTKDNSAFDIAFEVKIGDKSGLIGLECKYTDTFSSTAYDNDAYKTIFEKSHSFAATYDVLKSGKYNQLFRNQLIAEALVQQREYNFVFNGLFCYQEDTSAIKTALEMKQMLTNPRTFSIITYSDYIEKVQRLDLTWEQREWTMLLWARYCATVLSEATFAQLEEQILKSH